MRFQLYLVAVPLWLIAGALVWLRTRRRSVALWAVACATVSRATAMVLLTPERRYD